MKSLEKICWISAASFTIVMVLGCAGISKKQIYLNKYKVTNEGKGCSKKGISIESEPNIIRTKSLVKRSGIFIFPFVLINYWNHRYDYDIGNDYFDWKIMKYIETHLQKNKGLCEILKQNDSLSVNLNIKNITIKGSFINHIYLIFLLCYIPYSKESCIKIISEISSDIQIKIGRKILLEKSFSTTYETPGQVYERENPAHKYIPIDIKGNFNSSLNKYAGEIVGYISIANINSKNGFKLEE